MRRLLIEKITSVDLYNQYEPTKDSFLRFSWHTQTLQLYLYRRWINVCSICLEIRGRRLRSLGYQISLLIFFLPVM